MTYISLYRKWRPQLFSELVGQDHIAKTLSNSIANDRVAHAYLFTGPRGTGKTSTAKILAKALNCDKGPTLNPCQKCVNCRQITDNASLDVLEIDAASNRGIDEIRDLRDKVHFSPASGRKKVYIIDEVHMLTNEAFNALLKMLEEPPAHVIFVLATTEPSKVLPTIISRCQRFDFRRITYSDLIKQLKTIAKAEKIKIEDLAVELVAKQAQGGLRDAISMLDQLASFTKQDINTKDVIELLGLIGTELLFNAVNLIITGASSEIFSFTNQLIMEGRDLRQFTKELIEHGRNIFIIQNNGADELISATSEDIVKLKEQAKKLSLSQIRRLLDVLSQALVEMKLESNPQYIFELSLLRAMRPETDESVAALQDRVEQLEKQLAGSPEIPLDKDFFPETPDSIKDSANQKGQRELERFWPTIMAKIKQKSLSTYAVLLECRPLAIENDKLVIAIDSDWQKILLEKESNISVIKWALKNILQADYEITYKLDSADTLSKAPPTVKAREYSQAEENDVTPEIGQENQALNLLKDSFGAEIVE